MADFSYLKKLSKPIAIAGLATTGSAVIDACDQAEIDVHLWDDNHETREKYQKRGYIVKNFEDSLDDYAFLVPTAGMKPSHSLIQKAIKQKIPIKSDIDLLYQSAPKATYIGITGTNGKSTTTTLLSHIFKTLNIRHEMGGNIGIAAARLPSLKKNEAYILEVSSYQLEITSLPIYDIAVCLNIAADHLAWHGSMEKYIMAKKKIFRTKKNQKQIAILGHDDPFTKEIFCDLSMSDDHDVINLLSVTLPDDLDNILTLQGQHNQQNIAAAYAICQNFSIKDKDFVRAVKTFPGLIHRQQIVDTINGITFINDSKATNAESALKALNSFKNIHWIAGGEYKGDDLSILKTAYSNIKHAYLIGEAAPLFEKDMKGTLPYSNSGKLENAIEDAFKNASDGDVILLSTACASFDQYKNFAQRGEHFIHLVQDIKQRQNS